MEGLDDYLLGVLEACFYFKKTVEELVEDEELRRALLKRVNLLVVRIERRCAKTLPTKLLF